jgi:hypothetical protein
MKYLIVAIVLSLPHSCSSPVQQVDDTSIVYHDIENASAEFHQIESLDYSIVRDSFDLNFHGEIFYIYLTNEVSKIFLLTDNRILFVKFYYPKDYTGKEINAVTRDLILQIIELSIHDGTK